MALSLKFQLHINKLQRKISDNDIASWQRLWVSCNFALAFGNIVAQNDEYVRVPIERYTLYIL